MKIIWKEVIGFEDGYEVSNDGQVRSLDKYIPTNGPKGTVRFVKGRILKGGMSGSYPYVTLGRGNFKFIHTLVAENFIGPKPNKKEVIHADGNKTNNCVENLYYGYKPKKPCDAITANRRNNINFDTYKLVISNIIQNSEDIAIKFLFNKLINI